MGGGIRDRDMIKGIDVSHWQGDIDWGAIPLQYKFAFMKATEGTGFIDDKFSKNWFESKGILRGAYHFWRYSFDGTAQAEHFFDIVGATGDLGELPPVVDLEDTRAPKGGDIAIRMRQMLQRTEELFGKKPVIYTANWWWSPWTLNNTGFGDYDLWVAHYKTVYPWSKPYLPAGWDSWQIWQHSDRGKVAGIGGNVDLNVAKDEWFLRYETPEPEGRTITLIVPQGDTVEVQYAE